MLECPSMTDVQRHPIYQEDLDRILESGFAESLSGRRVTVTGASGLIGTVLVDVRKPLPKNLNFDIGTAAARRNDIALKSEETQFHSWLHATDYVSALLAILARGEGGLDYNIATDDGNVTLQSFCAMRRRRDGGEACLRPPERSRAAQLFQEDPCRSRYLPELLARLEDCQ